MTADLSSAKQALLAQRLRRRAAVTTIAARPEGTAPPLSHAQERFWFLEQYVPGTAAYVVPFSVRLTGELDEDCLRLALTGVTARHESLRTRFVTTGDGRPEVVVDAEPRISLRVTEADGEDGARALVHEEIVRPFDLAEGPLLRALVVRLGPRDHVLLLTMHHAVTDGSSCDILIREILTLHDDHRSGRAPALPPLAVQYGDYAIWQRARMGTPAYARDVAYWKGRLAGLSPLELPADLPRPATQVFDGAAHGFPLDAGLASSIVRLGDAHGATPYMTLMAAFQVLLARYSGATDFAVGSPISGRGLPELEPVVGVFVNTLPLRADLSGDPTFAELLGRCRETALDAYAHQELPFDQLVNELAVERDVSRSPVFQVLFALQNYRGKDGRAPEPPGFTMTGFPFETNVTRFDLALYVNETPDGGLWGNFTFNTALFLPETVARMAGHFESLLRAVVADPGARVSRVELPYGQALEFAASPAPAPPPCELLHELVTGQAGRTPAATAVVHGETSLTYAELDARSNRLARHLVGLGVGPGERVALCLEQSTELAVAVVGVLKAGGAYVPLDPEHPEERLAYALADAGVRVAITTTNLTDHLQPIPTSPRTTPANPPIHSTPLTAPPPSLDSADTASTTSAASSGSVPVLPRPFTRSAAGPSAPAEGRLTTVCLDTGVLDGVDPGPVETAVTGRDLAYVIYTSGTTGKPKGVAVQHREVLLYLSGVRDRFAADMRHAASAGPRNGGPADAGFEPGGSFALLQSLAFDFGVTVFYLSLMTGGTLHLIPSRTAAPDLARHFARTGIDYLKITPSHLAALLAEATPEELLPRRLLVLGGEASPWAWAKELAALGRCAVVNHYGPTEATVGVTTLRVDPAAPDVAPALPIGRPLPGARAYVLDENLRPAPVGVPGEIYLGGERLARGYLGRPALTAERFLPDPYGGPGARMYRTGDLGRWLPDGDLQFLGRRDLQVKVRGYRVELGEIETLLQEHPAVAHAVVDLRDRGLVGYLVAAEPASGARAGETPDAGRDAAEDVEAETDQAADARPGAGELRAWIRERLPDYMVPARYVWLDAVPLKSHGKVDRAALPEPDDERPGEGAGYVPPETPLEEAVAEVWAKVLGLGRVGALDDFFDLGGHSLLAMQVIARLRSMTGTDGHPVTIMDLFKHSTVRALARLMELGDDGPRKLLHRLTPVRRTTASLVCAPYGGGSAVIYKDLADALPKEWALYSIAVPGHELGESSRPVDEVAAGCVEEVLATVTDGPLVVYGHCGLGVMLAVEIVRRLEAAGRTVDAVYLGGIFPFARPKGFMSRVSDALERLRSDQVMANALTAAGMDVERVDPEQLRLIIRNRRQGTREAERYFGRLFEERTPPFRAPVVAVVGERDPATEFYQERFREWHCVSDAAALVVLDEAGHFFMKYRARELARILTEVHPAVATGRTGPYLRREDSTWWLHDTSPAASAEAVHDEATPDKAGLDTATPDKAPLHPAATEAAGTVWGTPETGGGPRPSMRRFGVVAAGQLLSITGSALTEFAIPIWIYVTTGSLVSFALFAVLGLVPGMLVSPLAGAIVDRSDRRRVMLAGDVGAGCTQLVLGALLWTGNLQIWHIYPLLVLLSVSLTFQRVAFGSAIPQLVPKRYLGHANGVVQMAVGTAQLVVPLVAAGLMATIGLSGILVIDVASYAAAILSVALVRFPSSMAWKRRESVVTEMVNGFRHSWGDRSFRSMLLFFAVLNIFLSPLFLMISPLVLSSGTLADVGRVAFAGGLGVFLGGLAMTVWGGPRGRRLRGVLLATLALAVFCLVTGLRDDLVVIGIGAFGMSLWLTLLNGVYATIIQVKVPQRFHGRVIALNTLVAWSTLPIGFGLVAPYGTAVFEPLLAHDGPLAGTVGTLIGTGPGRGIGFMYVCFALAMAVTALVAMRVKTLARFDDTVPDALPDDLVGVQALRDRAGTGITAAATGGHAGMT
ncbi:MFS transporter [Sphaerisporangium album]|uniref:MFS transporter n=1 Tax=Sphaerisporangium album TaxID=509200 RepID=A0A367FTJ0_9ACTN|nr:non-ribosomal peptide synthetase/MFS transporter [Sphaerisporangium album]RCG33249.1 MFS transporter [Sphaerisporangium album]